MSLSKPLRQNASLTVGDEIGRGGNGTVYAGKLNGCPVAVKKIHGALLDAVRDGQGDAALTAFLSECTLLESIVHPLIVGFKGAFHYQSAEPVLVMEKMNQDLRQLLRADKGKLTYQREFQLCHDVAEGLRFLHRQDPPLVHRDLSAKNILLDELGRAKLGDLGQSKLKIAAYFQTKQPGAVPYMPPEALAAQPHYDEKIDIFSYGVLMLEIATQQEPNPGLQGIGVVPEKDRRQVDFQRLPGNHPLRPLILSCLKDAPDQRPDAVAVLEELEKVNPFDFQQAKYLLADCVTAFLEHLNAIQAFFEQIQDCPRSALTMSSKIQNSLQVMLDATKQEQMKVVFLGNTSNGKSTILNALIKKKVLPVGRGITTKCFCTITGVLPSQLQLQGGDHADGYCRTSDLQKMKLTELADCMESKSIKVGDILEIHLPSPKINVWLNEDVVLIDSPGLGAADEVDELVKKTCGDADVFVYVCNGNNTLEEPVKKFLEKVNRQLPNLSKNLFVLFNHWDEVVEDEDTDSEKLKRQHLQMVEQFLLNELQADTVLDRTFFVSGKEACKVQEIEKNEKQRTEACTVLKTKWQDRMREFRNLESQLHDCLSGSAIQTKCGRHWESCTEFKQDLIEMMEQFMLWCGEGVEKLNRDMESKMTVHEQATTAEQRLQQTSKEKVESAMEDFGKMSDNFHDSMKEELRGTVELFRGRKSSEKWEDYYREVSEHLDMVMKNMIEKFQRGMVEFAIDTIRQFQDTCAGLTSLEEPQAQQFSNLCLEHPTCTQMTRGHRATPSFGRWMLDKLYTDDQETEVITVSGIQYEVPKRNSGSAGSEFSLGFLGAVAAMIFGAVPVSIYLALWAVDTSREKATLQLEQVKTKIISRLTEELDTRKQRVKSQCMSNLQRLLESQVENYKAALADTKRVLMTEKDELEQRIVKHSSWKTEANFLKDQLWNEVNPRLDFFQSVYLQ